MIAYGVERRRPGSPSSSGYEERAAALEGRRAEHAAAAQAAAAALTAARRAAAEPLARAIEVHLRELAMPHAVVEVVVEPAEPTDDGHDRVVYLLAANPGEAARPLARAASGGELSRAMLAARVVLSEAPPTLVFDEVDAGIGGEAGVAVGRLLADARRAAPGALRDAPRAGGGVRRHPGRGGEDRGTGSRTEAGGAHGGDRGDRRR